MGNECKCVPLASASPEFKPRNAVRAITGARLRRGRVPALLLPASSSDVRDKADELSWSRA